MFLKFSQMRIQPSCVGGGGVALWSDHKIQPNQISLSFLKFISRCYSSWIFRANFWFHILMWSLLLARFSSTFKTFFLTPCSCFHSSLFFLLFEVLWRAILYQKLYNENTSHKNKLYSDYIKSNINTRSTEYSALPNPSGIGSICQFLYWELQGDPLERPTRHN